MGTLAEVDFGVVDGDGGPKLIKMSSDALPINQIGNFHIDFLS